MPDAQNESASPSGFMRYLDVALKIVALLSVIVTAVVAVFGFIFWYATTPDGGITCQHRREASGVAGDMGETILTYEVYNPGPGKLSDIHLEIDVVDDYVDEKFRSDLECRFLRTTEGEIKTNGNITLITARPRTGGECSTMSPGDTFSVQFTISDGNWRPNRADICCAGGEIIDVLKKPLSRSRSKYTSSSYAITVLSLFAFGVTMGLWNILLRCQIHAKAKLKAKDMYDQETLDQAQPNIDILPKIITALERVVGSQNDNTNPPTSSQSNS